MKKIAYLVLAHNDSEHLSKLIKTLDHNSDFYIHIDKKSDISEFQKVINKKNAYFIKDRTDISWAGITMVDALMDLMKAAIAKSELYSHTVLITGSCYPIKNTKYIHEYFTLNPNKEFIDFIDMRDSPEHYMKLISQKWFKDPIFYFNNSFFKKIEKGMRFLMNKLKLKNSWDESITPYMGHTWCALTMDCCKYVHEYHINNPSFREINRFTFAPDEHYIHTIVGNSPFKENAIGSSEFKGRGLYKYTSIYLIDKSLQKWYDLNDWDEIANSDKLFVRKINSKTGKELVSKINNELLLS